MNMKNILEKKFGFKSYSDSTLRGMTKAYLIKEIRDLEHNWAGAEMCVERQSRLLENRELETTWHKYSEEKPAKFGTYLCKLRNSNSYKLITWVDEGKYSHWYTDNDTVYAWVEIPKCNI